MRFVLSAASSATLLFLVTLSLFAPAAVMVTAFEVTPDKAGFLDGVGGIKTKESSTTNEDGATTRIVGGDKADKTRYPYYAALFRDLTIIGGPPMFFSCGGSLIRPNVVVTAGEYYSDATCNLSSENDFSLLGHEK
jgi:Trypsin